jgi:hypothetical protein
MDLRVARRRVIGGRETHSFIRGIGVSIASTTRVRSLARTARRLLAREYFSDRLVPVLPASDARATSRARVNVGNRIVTPEGSRCADACEFEMIRDRRRRARRVPRRLARAR